MKNCNKTFVDIDGSEKREETAFRGIMGETLPNLPSQLGEYYDATVPDTLDLSERAVLAINHLTSAIDEDNNYEMYWAGFHDSMSHAFVDLPITQPKAMEALAMLRVMSGSRQNLEREAEMVEMMGSLIGDDGIFWIPQTGESMPWLGPEEMRPYAHIIGNGRMAYAMMQWYQYTGDIRWKERLDRMVDGLDRIMVVHKDDYAYFPINGWMDECYLSSCYIKNRGWKDTSEPVDEKSGEEGSLFNHQGAMAGALANWYRLSGNKQALRLAGELVRFITKPKFWADWKGGDYCGVVGAEHAHWHGHVHGHINTLRSILEYAIAVNDPDLMAFVRDGYEWTRQPVLSHFGLVGDGQGCGCGRLMGLAVKLCYAGVGDYWEDVDMYIRNMGTEMQFVPKNFSGYIKLGEDKRASAKVDPEEAMIGAFSSSIFKNSWAMCCSPHGSMGLFYAWDGILGYSDGVAQVNLLLNRASPWIDVESYIPYEGKVVLKNKSCKEVFVRIPLWVEAKTAECRIGDRLVSPRWFGRYIRFEYLKDGDVMTVEFPILERTEKLTGWSFEDWSIVDLAPQAAAMYALTFKIKGNTIVNDIQLYPWSPLFGSRADKYRAGSADMKTVKRFVTPLNLKW